MNNRRYFALIMGALAVLLVYGFNAALLTERQYDADSAPGLLPTRFSPSEASIPATPVPGDASSVVEAQPVAQRVVTGPADNAAAVPDTEPRTVETPPPPDRPILIPPPQVDDEVEATIAAEGEARVIVLLRDPQTGAALPESVAASAVLGTTTPEGVAVAHAFSGGAFSGTLDAAGLAALRDNPGVARVYVDRPVESFALRSVEAIRADQVQAGAVNGTPFTGAGVNVAIVDSGVNADNPDIAGSVVVEKCFVSIGEGCPGGGTEGDSAPDVSNHGTNVAGIITSPEGVAPDAGIVAIRVLDDFGRGTNSDWIRALNWIGDQVETSALNIDAVNLSLGTLDLYVTEQACIDSDPLGLQAIERLNNLGVAVIAATGNQGNSLGISSPACLPGVIGVGAVYDSDLGAEPDFDTYFGQLGGLWPDCVDDPTSAEQITCFTNSNDLMDVVAPGAQIIVARTGGSGTSQAAPHVTGVIALMRQADPSAQPSLIEDILKFTGPITFDPRNGESFRRVDALSAVEQLLNPTVFTGCAGVADVSESECEALLDIYTSLGGTGWSNSTNWLQTAELCTWQGITCDPAGGTITGLSLSANNLIGTLPNTIENLASLTSLDLDNNAISGNIPVALGSLNLLNDVILANNNLSGNVPAAFGSLTDLELLDLSFNDLSGGLDWLNTMTGLREVYLKNNNFSGSLPQLSNLPDLARFDAEFNELSGTIPDLTGLSNLVLLLLSSNNLEGSIPSLAGVPALQTLRLSDNALNGGIPDLSAVNDLFVLNLFDNNLSGTVPASLSTRTNLFILDLGLNQLEGPLPDLSSLANLNAVYLDSNDFEGDLNGIFGPNNAALDIVDLSDNNLSGTIPAEWGAFTSLTNLQLDSNNLSGTIPESLGSLTDLERLNLAANNLTGAVPPTLTNLTSLSTLDVALNQLTADTATAAFIEALQPGWQNNQLRPPDNLTLVDNGSGAVTLSWTLPSLSTDLLDVLQYEIINAHHNAVVYRSAPGVTQALLGGLLPNTRYNFAIRSYLPYGGIQLPGPSTPNQFYNVPEERATIPSPALDLLTEASIFECEGVEDVSFSECEALVSIYESLDGDNWINNDGWLQPGEAIDAGRLAIGTSFLTFNNVNVYAERTWDYLSFLNVVGEEPLDYMLPPLFSPDASQILTASKNAEADEGIIELFNTGTSSLIDSFVTSQELLTYDYNGTYLITIEDDGESRFLALYDVATGTLLDTLYPEFSEISAWPVEVAIGPADGSSFDNLIITIGDTFELYIGTAYGVDPETETLFETDLFFPSGGETLAGVDISPNADEAVFGSFEGEIFVWQNPGGSNPNIVSGTLDGDINDVTFGPDGTQILVGGSDGAALFTYDDLTVTPTGDTFWPGVNVIQVDLNYDGTLAMLLSNSSIMHVYDVPSGDLLFVEFAALGGASFSDGSVPTETGALVCDWFGITCENIEGEAVVEVSLPQNNLSGTIPPQVEDLYALKVLDLSNNLSGPTMNEIDGLLPQELTNLFGLEVLDLSGNQLTGPIPFGFNDDLWSLNTIDLSDNNLTGDIPTDLADSQLEVLDLSSNQLTWNPDDLFSGEALFDELQELELSDNLLSGPIPVELADISTLVSLSLAGNSLDETIPSELASLFNLTTLDLSGNLLEGGIPPQFGSTLNLASLNLGFNKLGGPIPTELGNAPALQTLNLENNDLTGPLPFQISDLPGLNTLDVSNNFLAGELPDSLGDTSLSSLDLGFNLLFTTLPELDDAVSFIDPDWDETQTIPPTNVTFSGITPDGAVTVSWDPIPYTDGSGYYELICSGTSVDDEGFSGYTPVAQTSDKLTTELTLENLQPNTANFCAVRTSYDDSGEVFSEPSEEVFFVTPNDGQIIDIERVPNVIRAELPPDDAAPPVEDACTEANGQSVLFAGQSVLFAGQSVLFAGQSVLFAGQSVLFASTEGSDFDTTMTVWRVPEGEDLNNSQNREQVICNDNSGLNTGEPGGDVERPPDAQSFTSYVELEIEPGFDYYFMVFGSNGETGDIQFNIGIKDDAIDTIPQPQADALQALYDQTDGPNWTNNTGWFENNLPCTWFGVTCQDGSITGLSLPENNLVGSIPPEIGNLTQLDALNLSNNALRGSVPPQITNLSFTYDLDLGFNALRAPDAAAEAFLGQRDPDWDETQTVPPTNISVTSVTNTSLTLGWTPILYTAGGGYYEAACGTDLNGPYPFSALTVDKLATGVTVSGLAADTDYFCIVSTFSAANTLLSDPSAPVAGRTAAGQVENQPPTITLLGDNPLTVEVFSGYSEPGFTASDPEDGDLTGAVQVDASALNTDVLGSYLVSYSVTDSGGLGDVETRSVNVVDTVAPVITLIGDSLIEIPVNTPFSDPGATAQDNYDGDISGQIIVTGTVDVNTPGDYELTYTISDSSTNPAAPVVRTVRVLPDTGDTPVVTGFTLIDENTDQPVPGFDPIPQDAVINVAEIGTTLLNIRANISTEETSSVLFGLNNNPQFRIENVVPYALAGDILGDYFPWNYQVDTDYTVTATPFTGPNTQGSAGTPLALNFRIINAPQQVPEVESFTLIDAATNQPVAGFDPIPQDAVINIAQLNVVDLNIRANFSGNMPSSVRFSINAVADFSTENVAPFTLGGDNNGDILPWSYTLDTPYTVTATPFTGLDAGGSAGTPLALNFVIVDEPLQVSSFTLIDAATDQPIPGFDPIPQNAVINISQIGTSLLNIRANVSGDDVGSVRFGLNDVAQFRMENLAPYALDGDNRGDYFDWSYQLNTPYLVTATPFTGINGQGTAGVSLTLVFTIVDEPVTPPADLPQVTSFTLFNAETDQPVPGFDPIPQDAVIDLSAIGTGQLNIRANLGTVPAESVRFGLNAIAAFSIEEEAPYFLAGNNNGDILAWTLATGTPYTVTATPFTETGGTGSTGAPLTLTFTLVDGDS
ncbi:MAG: immunoglobulin-like domain-containing protein [Chloroflexota bacterium]